jgi:hypothetical protein
MHFAMKTNLSARTGLASLLLLGICSATHAQSAYITQVDPHSSGTVSSFASQPTQTVPISQFTPSQTAFVPTPTPELAAPRNGNIAQTLEIGNANSVFQAQSGGRNFSNVGIIGGNANNVGVLQGGKDVANVGLINTQGLSVWVLQPSGAPPLNALVAKLPNGSLLIKR